MRIWKNKWGRFGGEPVGFEAMRVKAELLSYALVPAKRVLSCLYGSRERSDNLSAFFCSQRRR